MASAASAVSAKTFLGQPDWISWLDELQDGIFPYLNHNDLSKSARTCRLFAQQSATLFPQAAAPHLVSEVHSAFGRMTQDESGDSHLAFSPNEEWVAHVLELRNPQPLKQSRVIEIIVSYVPEETYQMAAQRVDQYFGADLLAEFGGFKAYACFGQFTLGFRRKYIDRVNTAHLVDGQKKQHTVMRTMDRMWGRLGLAVRYQYGKGQVVRVFHQRYSNSDKQLACAGEVSMTGVPNELYPPRAEMLQEMRQMIAGTHLTTIIPLHPETAAKHQTHLQQTIGREVDTALKFFPVAAFKTPEIRNHIVEYTGVFSKKRIFQYQDLTRSWTRYLPQQVLSAVGGLIHVTCFPMIDATDMKDLPWTNNGKELAALPEISTLIAQQMIGQSALVLQKYFPKAIVLNLQQNQQTGNFVLSEETSKDGNPPPFAVTPLKPEDEAAVPSMSLLTNASTAEIAATIEQIMLGLHPKIQLAK